MLFPTNLLFIIHVTVVNVNRLTYNQQNSAECFAPAPTKPKIFSGDMPRRFIIGQHPDLGTAAKKQPTSAAYKDREIHISINWRRSSSYRGCRASPQRMSRIRTNCWPTISRPLLPIRSTSFVILIIFCLRKSPFTSHPCMLSDITKLLSFSAGG